MHGKPEAARSPLLASVYSYEAHGSFGSTIGGITIFAYLLYGFRRRHDDRKAVLRSESSSHNPVPDFTTVNRYSSTAAPVAS